MPSQTILGGALRISVGNSKGGKGVSVGVSAGVCVGTGVEVDAGVEVGTGSGDTVVSIITGNPGSVAGGSVAGASVAGASVAAAPPQDVRIKHRIRINRPRRIIRTHSRTKYRRGDLPRKTEIP